MKTISDLIVRNHAWSQKVALEDPDFLNIFLFRSGLNFYGLVF